jgi:hypothetical protein
LVLPTQQPTPLSAWVQVVGTPPPPDELLDEVEVLLLLLLDELLVLVHEYPAPGLDVAVPVTHPATVYPPAVAACCAICLIQAPLVVPPES